MHCVLLQIARHFAANSPKAGANASPLEYKFILLHSHANPFLHQNKPSRESNICGRVSDWWTKRALIMLNFLLKTRQRMIVSHTRAWATTQKTRTLTTANATVCRVCCSRPTETTSWKCRNNLPLTARFQLVENTLNDFRLVVFWDTTKFWHRQMGQKIRFYRVFVQYFALGWGVYLGFTVQGQ